MNMNTAFLTPKIDSLHIIRDNAVSEDAKTVQSRRRDLEKSRQSSISLGLVEQRLFQALFETYIEASHNNWDSYGARAITKRTLSNALRFISSFSPNFPIPEVSAEPDGEIAFDWQVAPYKILSVSVGENNELSYAGLFGSNKIHGTELFLDEFPKALLEHLSRVYTTT